MDKTKKALFEEFRRWKFEHEQAESGSVYSLRACDRAMALWVVILEAELENEYNEWFEQNRKPYEIRL